MVDYGEAGMQVHFDVNPCRGFPWEGLCGLLGGMVIRAEFWGDSSRSQRRDEGSTKDTRCPLLGHTHTGLSQATGGIHAALARFLSPFVLSSRWL